MKFLPVVLIILFAGITSLSAAGEHQFGLGYSTISGGGLSYQAELHHDVYLMINAFPYYFGEDPPHDLDLILNAGAELQFDLWELNNKRLYLLAGGSFFYVELRNAETVIENDIEIFNQYIHINRIYNYGAGIGFEYILNKMVAISASIGLQGQTSGISDRVSSFFDRNPEGETFWGIGGSIGVRYVFP